MAIIYWANQRKSPTLDVRTFYSKTRSIVSGDPLTRMRVVMISSLVRFGVLLSLPTLLAGGARWWWPLELMTHFRVHYALMLAPLTIALVVGKRYLMSILTGGCLLWNLWLIAPAYIGLPVSDSEPVVLRLMSANVHTGNRNYERFLRAVRSAAPDVLLVMEIDDRWNQAIEALEADYPHHHRRPRRDNFGIGLFAKLPVQSLDVQFVGTADVPSIHARVEVGDQTVTIFGIHPLPPTSWQYSALRNEQLQAIADLAAATDGLLIVMGDLNVSPWSPYFRDLLSRSRLRDSRRGFGIQPTWPSRYGPGSIPIDHVLVSKELSVINRWVGPHLGSDHRAVIVDIGVARGAPSGANCPPQTGQVASGVILELKALSACFNHYPDEKGPERILAPRT